jgi:hypothetical protein
MISETIINPADPERMCRNLATWAELTALCIELRKSVLRAQTGVDDDEELTRLAFAEAVRLKEQKWKLRQP